MQEKSTDSAKDTLRNELDRMQEREKATQKILRAISESRADEEPVLDAIVQAAARLCDANVVGLSLVNETRTRMYYTAVFGAESDVFLPGYEFNLDGPIQVVQTVKEARTIHTADLADDPLYRDRNPIRVKMVEELGVRTFLTVPLIKAGEAFGCLNLNRTEVRPFADDDIALIETFATQAVIAIENVRQFREVQTRLERERASAEILKVISRSRDDEIPVFDAILKNAAQLCDVPGTALYLVNEEQTEFVLTAEWGSWAVELGPNAAWPLDGPLPVAQCIRTGQTVHLEDVTKTDLYRDGHPSYIIMADKEGLRSRLCVPLVSSGRALGAIALSRRVVLPFSEDEIALVESFAAQAVIAIENVRQFKSLEARTEEVQKLNSGLESQVAAQVGEIERMGRLKRFLSPQVADAVLSSGDERLLSSHRALLGILFCDIRGFTAFCETAEPEETIEVLQTYHEEMGALIAEHGAGVDTRAGDGIMVLFNDPLPCDDPAGDALRLGLAMRSRMEELCSTWRRHGHKLGFGVGISLGYATVGMVGAAGRNDYTASGTAVNLAARLCDKAADGEILLSPRAYAAIAEDFAAEAIGEISLKGIHAQVEVFRVSDGN